MQWVGLQAVLHVPGVLVPALSPLSWAPIPPCTLLLERCFTTPVKGCPFLHVVLPQGQPADPCPGLCRGCQAWDLHCASPGFTPVNSSTRTVSSRACSCTDPSMLAGGCRPGAHVPSHHCFPPVLALGVAQQCPGWSAGTSPPDKLKAPWGHPAQLKAVQSDFLAPPPPPAPQDNPSPRPCRVKNRALLMESSCWIRDLAGRR